MRNVEQFAKEKDLEDILDVLKRGALVAQDPSKIDHLEVLKEDEREALITERDHKWKHPMALYMTIIICSIGAAVQGWDQTGSVWPYLQS